MARHLRCVHSNADVKNFKKRHSGKNFMSLSKALHAILNALGERLSKKLQGLKKKYDEPYNECRRCDSTSGVDGICPYEAEICGVERMCTCCEECRQDCANDI